MPLTGGLWVAAPRQAADRRSDRFADAGAGLPPAFPRKWAEFVSGSGTGGIGDVRIAIWGWIAWSDHVRFRSQ